MMQKGKNTMLNKNNAESNAVELQGMIELNEQELAAISGGWGGYDDGDFDEGYGSSRRSFEKIVVIKRRFSRRHFDYDDFDD
ncbi:bacteriocin [Dictyobacter aurantiacus]|uniref:Bacteriocin n=1 Tax=Dictyobacter aurantiacus TaxID=1936993 RepID=A0A401ZIN8_9CHLR|nr:bacteriocin [Dictyobacter aurantiacus]GCE06710.1 hypothetical protein KDAU_40390 [Dictyobacter aurantiacus]